jgi:protein-tyrosine-phosphatase
MAEALLRHRSVGRIHVSSEGSLPRPEIHPLARKAVKDLFGLDMEGQYPKSLDQFVGQRLDYVISVCDRADASCPIFPGDTERIH